MNAMETTETSLENTVIEGSEPSTETTETTTTEGGSTSESTEISPESVTGKAAETTAAKKGAEPAAEKGKKTAEERIQELVAERKAAEEKAAYYKGLAEGRKPAETSKTETTPAVDLNKEPNSADFKTWDEYQAAHVRWQVRQELKAEREAADRKAVEERQKTVVEGHFKRLESVYEKDPSFKENYDKLPVNPVMAAQLWDNERSAEILHHLYKNPAEAQRLFKVGNPIQMAREIGRIEAGLTAPAPSTPTPKKTSTASAPITTVSGNATPKGEPDLNTEEGRAAYIAARNKAEFGY